MATLMIPALTADGDLPQGIHTSGWQEIEIQFGIDSESRRRACARLQHLHELASRTGKLRRFIVFGSFVSTIPNPGDLDLALVMAPEFKVEEAPRESRTLFSHADAEARFGASIFWVREGMLTEEMMQVFLETWQTKRNGNKRGILEVLA